MAIKIKMCSFYFSALVLIIILVNTSSMVVSGSYNPEQSKAKLRFGEINPSKTLNHHVNKFESLMRTRIFEMWKSKNEIQFPYELHLEKSLKQSSLLNDIIKKAQTNSTEAKFKLKQTRLDPDANRNLTQLITSQGYPVERFLVKTQDGFLLDLHRIPRGRHSTKSKSAATLVEHLHKGTNVRGGIHVNHIESYSKKNHRSIHTKRNKNWDSFQNFEDNSRPAIFLQHGYMSSACDFVMNFANDSLAFVLADAGYDVWLGNSRGNTYSNRHVSLNIPDDKFWDWSFDEMAEYDTTAFIDFILNKTGQKSLFYIGHSQGTMVAFALLSNHPEYQKKIRLFVGLAPIMSLANMKSPMKYLAQVNESLIYDMLGRKDCFLGTNKTKKFAQTICADPATRWVCYDMLFLTNGPDISNLNQTRLPVYMSHTPAGTSVKTVVHYAQMIREKRFTKYDYGTPSDNIKRYGQPIPPAYNVSNVRVPSILFSAGQDWLADHNDVSILESILPNIRSKYNYPTWNHMDFVLGMNAADKCYSQILKELTQF